MTRGLPFLLTALLSTAQSASLSTDPLGHEVRTWYDRGGLPRFVRDARDVVTENRYDALGRLVETIAPTQNGALASTKFQYDAVGNQTRVEDGNGHATAFTYDHGNRVLLQTFANGDQVSNTYDARNLRTRTDAAGTVAYGYDAEDRLASVDPPGSAVRTYGYDLAGRLTGVAEADNPTANVAYAYDALDRVVSETSRGLTHTHTYDLAGNPLTTAYSSGANVTRTYNDLGLISTLADNAGRTTSWQYDQAGRARALILPNGQVQANVYDPAGRLSSRTLKTAAGIVLAAFAWGHDAAGNVTAQSEAWPGSPTRPAGTRVVAMSYHDGGWLKSEQVTEPGQATKLTLYGYDNAANRTGKTVSENNIIQTATTYTFNPANQLTAWTERNGAGDTLRSASLTFDGRGNRTGQTLVPAGGPAQTTSYTWDFQNRLVGVTDASGGQHAYAYDFRTRRIARSEPGGSTAVSWSGGLSLAEYAVSGIQSAIPNPQSPIVEYRRGPDMGGGIGGLLHTLRGGVVKYNLGNGRGDIVAQTDQAGALTWTSSYEAFGKRPVETGSNADRQRANTKEEDPTGLLWEHFRYRDLETGVWLSRDPAGFVDGPNLYAYVNQNPWSYFDPLGLYLEDGTPENEDEAIETHKESQDAAESYQRLSEKRESILSERSDHSLETDLHRSTSSQIRLNLVEEGMAQSASTIAENNEKLDKYLYWSSSQTDDGVIDPWEYDSKRVMEIPDGIQDLTFTHIEAGLTLTGAGQAIRGAGSIGARLMSAIGRRSAAAKGGSVNTWWVGKKGKALAEDSGGKTLTIVPGAGTIPEQSAAAAAKATGPQRVFIGPTNNPEPLFWSTELPRLLKRMDKGEVPSIEITF